MAFSQAKISSIFESTNTARRRLSFGATRTLPLVVKHVKPIKVARSRLTNEFGPNEWFVPKAQAEMCAADAPVLRETDSWAGRELGSFDLTDRRFDHLAKLPTLLFGNRSQQILNLRNAFPHESHNGNVGDASDPGVANQLKVKRCQPLGLVGVTSTGGFPFEQTPCAVQVADGIDIGHEFVAVCEWTNDFFCMLRLGWRMRIRLSRANCSSRPIPWRSRRSQSSPWEYSSGTSRYVPHSLNNASPASWRSKSAASAFSKHRPKHSAARDSFSLQPSR